jgi:hypothetical protein
MAIVQTLPRPGFRVSFQEDDVCLLLAGLSKYSRDVHSLLINITKRTLSEENKTIAQIREVTSYRPKLFLIIHFLVSFYEDDKLPSKIS